jgi:hypothetical protein
VPTIPKEWLVLHARSSNGTPLYVAIQWNQTTDVRPGEVHHGGDSVSFLLSILEEASELVPGEPSTITEKFSAYGPALVSRFEVHSDFYNNQDCHKHHGMPSGIKIGTFLCTCFTKVTGYHAMVLIGLREEQDKRYFLLQNWFKKQFVEVDED